MERSLQHQKWDPVITAIVLVFTGCVLVILHYVLALLPFNNVIEALLFSLLGYLFGKKVSGSSWLWGIALALPAMLLIVFRIFTAPQVTGFEPYITLILLPFAACLGMYIRIHYHHHKHNLFDKHILND